jgi:hypothetical protein
VELLAPGLQDLHPLLRVAGQVNVYRRAHP